jgi:DNA primase
MDNIEEIKARIDIVDLVSETVQLRRSGRSYTGYCPFHDNKRTPAFAVFPESGTWRCFGQCNEGGDIFKFLMKKEGWEFGETLRHLADRAGVTLRQLTPQEEQQRDENERLRELLEDAVTFFRHNLYHTPAGKAALDYLHGRGLTDATIETWGLGYAPDAWEAGKSHFAGRGYAEQDMLDAGMLTRRDDGRTYDRFRHRVTFAIRDERGRMAGFGARTLDPDGLPKYLNSPQTVLFDKGGLLYGLDRARQAIRAQEQAVVVEGYMDVIALHQAGFANAISPMGTALTETQLRQIKKRTRRIILALDADAAGNAATLRGLEVARRTLDRETEIGFDPRGLLSQEARLQADIRVTTLPAGNDPDEVVQADPAAWQKIIADAKPVVIHVMDTLAASRNLDDPKVKTEIASQVLPLIEDVPSPIERDTYRQRLARLLKVDERTLIGARGSRGSRAPQGRRAPPRERDPAGARQPSAAAPGPFSSTHTLEVFCLGILIRHPNFINRVDRALQSTNLHRLSAYDFQDTGHQNLVSVIKNSVDQDFDVPQNVVIGSVPLALHEQVDAILAATQDLRGSDTRLLEDILRAILDLRRRNVNQNISHLRFLMQDAQERGEMIVNDFQNAMLQHTTTLARLDQALRQTHDRSILTG